MSTVSTRYTNTGNAEASAATLSAPTYAYLGPNNELFVADSGNHRVLVMPASGTAISAATRVLGQDQFNFMSPNLVEGREFQFNLTDSNNQTHYDGGIVVDQNANPPHLYIADTYNNRILGFRDARAVG